MFRALALDERPQSLGEEIANSISHGVGLLAALAAFPVLVAVAVGRGATAGIVGACVFATTAVLLYVTSTLFHALPESRAKRVFQILDHAAIYFLIAGTYTPFTLGVLRGAWGWTLFGAVWAMAAAGIAVKLLNLLKHPLWSTGLYVAMGWSALLAAGPLMHAMPTAGLTNCSTMSPPIWEKYDMVVSPP